MKTLSKILILIAVFLLLVISVLIYYRHLSLPPKGSTNEKEVITDIENSIGENWHDAQLSNIVDRLHLALDKQEVYKQNGLLSNSQEQIDVLSDSIAELYLQALYSYSSNLTDRAWTNKEPAQIGDALSQISLLEGNYASDRTYISVQNQVQEYKELIKSVVELTNQHYTSLEQSRILIDIAWRMQQNEQISTNKELSNRLERFPRRLARQHVKYVSDLLDALNDYSSKSYDEWNQDDRAFREALGELGKDETAEVYGVSLKTEQNDLYERYKVDINAAYTYYYRNNGYR